MPHLCDVGPMLVELSGLYTDASLFFVFDDVLVTPFYV